ncbi:MAG: hypothetical protein C5B43_03135 [Verrucomicrobia bacterium]|nr:MAG: hypothetical protein C5B43_03135 [Verrucomicrobiota bacterium]
MKIKNLITFLKFLIHYLLIFTFLNGFAYQELDTNKIQQLKKDLSIKYQKGEMSEAEVDEFERVFIDFKQLKIKVQIWLDSIGQPEKVKLAKEEVSKDIKKLADKKDSELSQHFTKEFQTMQEGNNEEINALLRDIDKIIDMLPIKDSASKEKFTKKLFFFFNEE